MLNFKLEIVSNFEEMNRKIASIVITAYLLFYILSAF